MNTIKKSKQFAINPFYRGYLLALKDIIKLIDDIFRSSNFNKEIAKELKQRIEG